MSTSAAAIAKPAPSRAAIVREALGMWALAFGGIVVAKAAGLAIPFLGRQVKAVAAGLFLYLPGIPLRRRGETLDDYGVPDWPWISPEAGRRFRRDLAWAAVICAILLPLVVGGFVGLLHALPLLPAGVRELVVPYVPGPATLTFRLPERMWLHVLDQLFVVALPEELFYRGYLQTRLGHAFGKGRAWLLGAPAGAAFWLTQLLFALGHLGELHPWRLAVFFPSILFGWLRERTGSIGAGILVHAFCNLLLMVLEASAFGR